jgi:hypothetical protein
MVAVAVVMMTVTMNVLAPPVVVTVMVVGMGPVGHQRSHVGPASRRPLHVDLSSAWLIFGKFA